MKLKQQNLFEEINKSKAENTIIIKSKNTNGTPLSKEQKKFNRLVKKIEKLTKDIETKEKHFEETLSKYHEIITPKQKLVAQQLIDLSKKIDHFLQKFKYTKTQDRELSAIISSNLASAFCTIEPDEELQKLHNKYSFDDAFNEMDDSTNESDFDSIIDFFEFQFGVKLDRDNIPDPKNASKEEISELLSNLFKSVLGYDPSGDDHTNQFKTFDNSTKKGKKTKAQQQRELKEKAAEELKNKSLRSLYISLAKALHPDTGGTEEEIKKKEELMKQVTHAYEKKDLSTLLTLEITWLQEEAGHTSKIADKQLKIYNQVLNEQIIELEQKENNLYANPRFIFITPYIHAKPKDIPLFMEQELMDINFKLNEVKNDLNSIKNKKTLLEYLSNIKDKDMLFSNENFGLLDNLFDCNDDTDYFW